MKRLRLIALLFGVLAMFGACSEDDPTVDDPEATEATDPEESVPADTADAIQAAATVQVAETDLGEVLVNEDQFTLYLFKQDTGEDSTCTGGCAETWPALEAPPTGDATAGDGVDEAELGTNDADQVTYHGHPLYTYSGDGAPGDTEGQGVGGNWYVVSPDGEAIEDE